MDVTQKSMSLRSRFLREMARNGELYLLALPVIAYYIIFHYVPMYGAQIAFKDFAPSVGIGRSPWVGLKHFQAFFGSIYFGRLIKNTLTISLTSLVFGFPAPIILALLLNELRSRRFSRVVQTITYMPHFISLVVICGMIREFTSQDGLISVVLSYFGVPPKTMLNDAKLFVPIYVVSGIWQGVGWGSIIYLAALTSIDQELYEAASIDGAGRWKQTIHITLPCLLPTVIVLLILRMGNIMSVGAEKIILLYNPSIYETADVISSYVYRRGLLNSDWSFSSAVGLFDSVVNFILVASVNWLSRRTSETSLW